MSDWIPFRLSSVSLEPSGAAAVGSTEACPMTSSTCSTNSRRVRALNSGITRTVAGNDQKVQVIKTERRLIDAHRMN